MSERIERDYFKTEYYEKWIRSALEDSETKDPELLPAIPLFKLEAQFLRDTGLDAIYRQFLELGKNFEKTHKWITEEVLQIYATIRNIDPSAKCKRCKKPLNHLQAKRKETFCSYICKKKYTIGE